MHSSIALTFDEAGIFKDAQVFRDGRKRNGERFSQIGDATFGPSQKIEDPASGRIGQGSEDGIEGRAVRMLNHMVKYATPCASATRISWYALRDSAVVRLDAIFLSALRIRARSGAGSAFSIFIERATPDRAGARPYHAQLRITSLSRASPDRAGARPYHAQLRITSLSRATPGSRGSASLPRTIADHVPFACNAGSRGRDALPRDPALYVWWPISLARLSALSSSSSGCPAFRRKRSWPESGTRQLGSLPAFLRSPSSPSLAGQRLRNLTLPRAEHTRG